MIAGQVSKPLLSLRSEMNAELRGEDKAATSDNELNEPLLAPVESNDSEDTPSKLFEARGNTVLSDTSPGDQHQPSQSHPAFPVGPQPLLTAQQLASAVAGVMPGGTPALNQPILIPFNMAGQLGGQQGLVLTLPTANLTNIQGLVAAAAAGGIMTLPLQNLQATSSLNTQLQQLQHLQQLQQQQQQQQQQGQQQQQQQQQSQQQQQTQQVHTPQPPQQTQQSQTQTSAPPQQNQTQSQSQSQQPPVPQSSSSPQKPSQSPGHGLPSPLTSPNPLQLVNNPLASQAAAAAAAAAMGSIASSQAFGNALSSLQGVTGQLVTNAQGQIIGTIPLMPNPVPSSQAAGGAQGLQVQPITPQLLTNAQGQIIATVIGNQILPVINTQGITLSPLKPGQQLHQPSQTQVGQAASQSNLLHLAHSQASMSQSPVRQASSSSSSSSSSSALSVGQLVSNPQTATGEVDGVNLEEIREFAKAFKIRRLSLGLTQTQVGQALSATEGPAYSQSAICRHTILRSHFFLPQEAQENTIASSLTAKLNPGLLYPARFEKLDITPKSAQKIKPVLERWMAEAEARHRAGMQNLTEFIGSEPSKKRKRRTSFTPQALEILNAHFEKNTHPSGQEMTEIAEKLNYDREVVRVWFCNKRQALKNTIKRLKQHEPATAVPMEPLTDSLEENS
ncbi:POU domain, class 6, transcription factor 2 isoform X1 [Oxyura jamaicensis]|uniref:POU domain, class 6, transcription factor 2 isoform X1 n=2 Tax=Oxyura jamaicensis TaxID=8884 RepID=UPI0015A64E6B|nr:POU domain, class 6, transcription factor 2 isoform X1 [Oxyura jamaicensis]XP_035175244.1 POU domain, class 6, transcription factor 2 isoform X1 [Oxyura jamaicensis]